MTQLLQEVVEHFTLQYKKSQLYCTWQDQWGLQQGAHNWVHRFFWHCWKI